jgi:hypothetical protein
MDPFMFQQAWSTIVMALTTDVEPANRWLSWLCYIIDYYKYYLATAI